MTRIRITSEALIDLFTPGALTPHKCVEGLPKGVQLNGVSFDPDTGIVEMTFDGSTEQDVTVVYTHVQEQQ